MSGTMSVDKQRFEQLESTVIDIDRRMISIEMAVPSIDQSLKELVKISQQQREDQAVQNEKNKHIESAIEEIKETQVKQGAKIEKNGKQLLYVSFAIAIIVAVVSKVNPDMQWILSVIKP